MQDIAIIAIASVVFVLAVLVAWKLTWFLLKLILWLVALGAVAGTVWYYMQSQSHPQPAVQQSVRTPRPP